jgi:glycosyltransferase involved in cell wall biosynthesis
VVVPCYNEAARLNVAAFRTFIARRYPVRFLFVNDGSRDRTFDVLEEVGCGFQDCVRILDHKQNKGKAEAVRTGIVEALKDSSVTLVGFWDADLATPLSSILSFMRVLEERPNIEMVFGSRVKLLGRQIHRRAVRHYLGRVFATAVSSVLRLPIYDSQCGAKVFRTDDRCQKVFAEPFLSKWVFDVEILARDLQLYGGDPKHFEGVI